MNFEILIPITLFLAIAYIIKVIVDARTRRALIGTNGSEELIRSIMVGEEIRQKHSSLRWGVTLLAIGAGFGLIEAGGWDHVTPGVIAVLALAHGPGQPRVLLPVAPDVGGLSSRETRQPLPNPPLPRRGGLCLRTGFVIRAITPV